MMDKERYARTAARLLASAAPEAGPVTAADRERALAALGAALWQRAHRGRRRRWTALGAAAAGLLIALGTAGAWLGRRPPGVSARLDGGGPLAVGSVVEAPAERAVGVSLSTGTRLQLGPGGRLDVAGMGPWQRFVLHHGRVHAAVARLGPGERFLVTAGDTEVEVRGTAFEVAVVPPRPECGGLSTEVRVLEGVVTVRQGGRDWQVGAGQRWPTCVPAVAAVPVPVQPATIARRPRPRPPAPPPVSTVASTLAEQNDLFSRAVRARQRGDTREARRYLDELLARFPFGPLAESAREERASSTAAATDLPP